MNQLFTKGRMAVAALVLSAVAVAAEAGTIKLTVDPSNYSGDYGAGEFKVLEFTGGSIGPIDADTNAPGGVFQTFCAESNENIAFSTTYDWTMSDSAVAGGYSGGSPDPLSAEAAYLFTQFWNGTLTDYDFTLGSGRSDSATALQLALWKLEGEIQPGDLTTAYNGNTQAQDWVTLATNAVSDGDWSGIGNVRVLNLTNQQTGANVQSVLVVIPLPPAALLGLGLMTAMGAVGAIRRRRNQQLA